MNKTIVGEIQSLIAAAETAQATDDFDELQSLMFIMSDHWHKLMNEVNKARPSTGNWLFDQAERSHFRTQVSNPPYRPVVTRPVNG